ncbi:MAG: hypothetical protein ACE14W_06790 [Candidatus Velamenicoccus archaeovorus]
MAVAGMTHGLALHGLVAHGTGIDDLLVIGIATLGFLSYSVLRSRRGARSARGDRPDRCGYCGARAGDGERCAGCGFRLRRAPRLPSRS